MAAVTTELDLNMQLPNVAVVSYAVQGDTLYRQITANLYDESTPWTPPAGALATVRFKKPDGHFGLYDTDEDGNTAVTWAGNVATIKIVQQALALAGDVTMQVNFYTSGGVKITAFSWEMLVQPEAVTDTEIISTDYFNILTQQIAQILGATIPASTSNPLMDGTASPGSSNTYSRGDHVHPKDTSKVDKTTTVNGKALSSNITLNASEIPNDSTVSGENVDDALDSLKGAIDVLIPTITGTTNNSGFTIKKGEYFKANNTLYQATASIPQNSAWGTSATAISNTAINALFDRTYLKTNRAGTANVSGLTTGMHLLQSTKPIPSNTPSGYRYVFSRLGGGDSVAARNHASLLGATGNLSYYIFYVDADLPADAGNVIIEDYFIPIAMFDYTD